MQIYKIYNIYTYIYIYIYINILSSSWHSFYCKKGIPYSQALRLNKIYSNNEFFEKNMQWLREIPIRNGLQLKNGTEGNTWSCSYSRRCTFREN